MHFSLTFLLPAVFLDSLQDFCSLGLFVAGLGTAAIAAADYCCGG